MAYEFTAPAKTLVGNGSLQSAGVDIKKMGSKALIVTDKVIVSTGLADVLKKQLDEWNIEYAIFEDLPGEPTDVMIAAGLKSYEDNKCDFLIAIGGGTPIDSAKAIMLCTKLPVPLSQYMGKEISGDFPALVAIPTTAGTGSEATKYTVITDTVNDVKMLLKGADLLPKLAILDAELTLTVPKSVTAATGMDALAHAIEAYTSKKANPLTDIYAISAIKKIFKYLPVVYKDGSDLEARKQLILAAYEGGICINNSSVTLVHGMSRPIGAGFHVPHGISNAMLIKECLSYVIDGAYGLFGNLAREINAASASDSDEVAAKKLIVALEDLCKICEIPTLKEYGIDEAEFKKCMPKMAEDAMISGSPSNTIKEVGKEDLLVIYDRLW